MDESRKKWVWLGLGAAAGAGLVWWFNRRGQQLAAQAVPQLPEQVANQPAAQATEGMVSGYGEVSPPPPPANPVVMQAPQSVPDNGNYTEGGDWDQNDEF